MNVLAIDYGKKKIGLAFAQTGLDLVLPAGQISGHDNRVKREKIVEIIKEKKVDKLVVGLPLGLNGEENDNTRAVKEFVEKLKKLYDIAVEFVDERFTSRQADRMGKGVSRDEKAAMIILQSYVFLQHHN
ncbi:MAG: Holliday junction resolvase RuvX [Candidatus Magasanikbacteria bacterium]|nr:Holliday junction resolvase RuvX [Candidatus Magasanikbacteria bacterium]